MIRFKKQWKELPAPIWLMIFSLQSPPLSSVLVTQNSSACSTSSPVTLRYVHEVGGTELAGQGWVAALCCFLVSVCHRCSAGMSLAHLGSCNWLNAHSVGGSGYRTKHTLTFLLKKVGSGFYVIFLLSLLHAVRVPKEAGYCWFLFAIINHCLW